MGSAGLLDFVLQLNYTVTVSDTTEHEASNVSDDSCSLLATDPSLVHAVSSWLTFIA